MKKYFELILLITVIGFVSIAKTQSRHTRPYVILVSFDELRHGFAPEETSDMGAIFHAKEPSFKSGLKIDKFRNIHLYPLIAEILEIRKLPEIDGQLGVLAPVLKD